MKAIFKRMSAFAMGLAVSVSLTGGALAYSTPDFADVPVGNWAYEPVMKMADAGIIKGSSVTTFAPEVKVSPAMWLTLVGRAVYEADVKAAAQAGDNWYNAYVRVAETKGLLTGTAIDKNAIEGEMTRYDMAATVYAAIKLLGAKDATVDTSTIKDYGMIPNMYTTAVTQVYATGLIKGDNAGNFNGTATMTRAEAATVMDRLIDLKAKLAETPAEPEMPEEDIPPRTGEMITVTISGKANVRSGDTGKVVTTSPAGVKVSWRLNGRELGTGISDENGIWTIVATIDKADFYMDDNSYRAAATYIDSNGKRYSNMFESSKNGDRFGISSLSAVSQKDYIFTRNATVYLEDTIIDPTTIIDF